MRLIDLTEADEQIGVVVSTSGGKFYDIDFVDYNTLRPLSRHDANIGRHFIETVRDNEAWEYVFPFFKENFQAKRLGEEYSSEDAEFFLFGPLSPQQLNMIQDKFEEMYSQ